MSGTDASLIGGDQPLALRDHAEPGTSCTRGEVSSLQDHAQPGIDQGQTVPEDGPKRNALRCRDCGRYMAMIDAFPCMRCFGTPFHLECLENHYDKCYCPQRPFTREEDCERWSNLQHPDGVQEFERVDRPMEPWIPTMTINADQASDSRGPWTSKADQGTDGSTTSTPSIQDDAEETSDDYDSSGEIYIECGDCDS